MYKTKYIKMYMFIYSKTTDFFDLPFANQKVRPSRQFSRIMSGSVSIIEKYQINTFGKN